MLSWKRNKVGWCLQVLMILVMKCEEGYWLQLWTPGRSVHHHETKWAGRWWQMWIGRDWQIHIPRQSRAHCATVLVPGDAAYEVELGRFAS